MALGLLRLVSGPTDGELCNVCRFQRSFVQRRMRRSVHTRINSQPPGERVSHNTPTPITHVLIAPPPQHCGAEVIKLVVSGCTELLSVGILLFPPPPYPCAAPLNLRCSWSLLQFITFYSKQGDYSTFFSLFRGGRVIGV